MTKNRKILIGGLLGVLILGMAGIALASQRDKGVTIRTEVVGQRDLVSIVTASGFIQPKRKVDISADVMGRVVTVAVEEGQWVEKGDLLLRIDPTSFQAATRRAEAGVAQARAQSAQARANWLQAQNAARRAEQLSRGENLISPADVEQAQTQLAVSDAQFEAARYQVAQAEAALAEAREALRKTTIVAPMSGRVTRLNIEEGETAVVGTMNNPGSLLLTIADLSEMEARVKVDETDVPHLSFGDSANIRIDAFPNREFVGRVTRIANSAINGTQAQAAQAQSVDFEVIITLSEPPEQLRPDLSATAEIVTETRLGALAVPILALTVRDAEGKKYRPDVDAQAPNTTQSAGTGRMQRAAEVEGVFVVRDGKAHFVPVQVGIAGDRYFEVRSGLTAGDLVAAGPYQAVRDLEDGHSVKLQNPEPTQTGESEAGSTDTTRRAE
jgi:HlyD family secretion protein